MNDSILGNPAEESRPTQSFSFVFLENLEYSVIEVSL